MGLVQWLLIGLAIIISAVGTHSRIPFLRAAPPKRKMTLARVFWEFSTEQISWLSLSVVLSAVLGLIFSPIVSKTLGKKRGATIILSMAQFPAGAMPSEVDPDTVYRLGLYYAPRCLSYR